MGWLFINAGFLAAGAAALTLPIWIHLMLRQRARPMEIGSVRFLQAVVRRTKRRQRIRRWLLLALRCAAMLLLGLLFARPFLPSAPADGQTREAVVLVDRSASMWSAGDNRDAAFDRAKKTAKARIAELGENARVHIAAFDGFGVQPLSADQFDDLKSPGYATTNYGEAIAWAADVLGGSARTHRSMLLVTDLQASGLTDAAEIAFPADIPVEIADVGATATQNLAIEAVRAVQVELRPGSPIAVSVQVLNAGALPISDAVLRLKLKGPSGNVALEQPCSLASGSRTTVRFELPIEQPGLYRGEVSVDYDDAFDFDNRRFLAFEVRHPDRVLLVDGDPGRTPWASETYFLETTLRLTNAIGDQPARTFEVERLAWERGDGFPDLTGFRLIVLANLGRLTASDARRLDQFMRDGGSVLMFPGERTTAAVLTPLEEVGILPAESTASPRDVAARVTEFDREHPALAPFADPQHGDLRRLTVRRLVPLDEKRLASDFTRLLQADELPLIVERPLGNGRFVFVATTADRAWNDWPQGRLYVPLFRQFAAYLTGQLDPRQSVRDELIQQPEASPGIEEIDEVLVVRNTDPRESEVQRLTEEQFRDAFRLAAAEQDEAEKLAASLAPKSTSRSDEYWPPIVLLLLAVLSAETLLASRVNG